MYLKEFAISDFFIYKLNKTSNKTQVFKDGFHLGSKLSKKLITVLLHTNMSDDKNLEFLSIVKNKFLKCFK